MSYARAARAETISPQVSHRQRIGNTAPPTNAALGGGAVGYGNGPAGCGAAWLARLLWEQEAAGSNPAIPTSSEHILILAWHSPGAKLGAMC